MSETIVVPDNGNGNNNNGWNSPLGLLALSNGGYGGWGNGGLFGGGLGAGIGAFFGSLVGNWFGGNGNGFGWNGGNGNAAAASLGAQATANNNTDLLMNAINGTDADVRLLATTLNADINKVQSDINTINLSAQQVGASVGLTGQQVINAIQAGNMTLAQQLAQCCCDMRQQVMQQGYENQIATLNQTNSLNGTINANGQRNVDAIADLKATMIQSFCDVKEREMQSKIDTQADIITQLRSAANNAQQTNQIIGYVNSVVAPLQGMVNTIAAKMPSTTSVIYPNLTVTESATTPTTGA